MLNAGASRDGLVGRIPAGWREASGYAVAAVLAGLVVAHLAEALELMLFVNADSLVTVLMARSLAAGQPQDWAMSPVLFIPETAVYFLLAVFGMGVRATLMANAAVNSWPCTLQFDLSPEQGAPVNGLCGARWRHFPACACWHFWTVRNAGDISWRRTWQ